MPAYFDREFYKQQKSNDVPGTAWFDDEKKVVKENQTTNNKEDWWP